MSYLSLLIYMHIDLYARYNNYRRAHVLLKLSDLYA